MRACAGAQGLLQAARFPLDKRPLQLHNLNLALAALQKAGIDAKVCRLLRSRLVYSMLLQIHINRMMTYTWLRVKEFVLVRAETGRLVERACRGYCQWRLRSYAVAAVAAGSAPRGLAQRPPQYHMLQRRPSPASLLVLCVAICYPCEPPTAN